MSLHEVIDAEGAAELYLVMEFLSGGALMGGNDEMEVCLAAEQAAR